MKYLLLGTILVFSTVSAEQPIEEKRRAVEEMEWMVEQYPPFNFVDAEDGKLKGITVDILMKMFERTGVNLTRKDMKVLPWANAYKKLQNKPNTALYSTTYTEDRLKIFKFVGPIVPSQVSIIAKKDKSLEINSIEDMNQLKIGVVREDIGEQLLKSLGVRESAIKGSNKVGFLVNKLHKGKLDAIAYAEDIAKFQFKLEGIEFNQYEVIYVLHASAMGYTFHKSADLAVIDFLQKALDELKADGTVDEIVATYLR
jgi:polar amino acid transport system substrate-binding protein